MTKFLMKNWAKNGIGKNSLPSTKFLSISSLLIYKNLNFRQKSSKLPIFAKALHVSYYKGYRRLKTWQANPIYIYKAGYPDSLRLRLKIYNSHSVSNLSVKSKNRKFEILKNSINSNVIGRENGKRSSKFFKITWRCIETIRNSVFRSDLNILLVHTIKSKIHSLKCFISISRGILNARQSSISNDPKKTREIDVKKSSKFFKITWHCIEIVRNSVFRSGLNILLPHMIKSKIHSLKRFISISRGILNARQSSISNDPVKIAKIYTSFKKENLPKNHSSSKSIHSLIREKLC